MKIAVHKCTTCKYKNIGGNIPPCEDCILFKIDAWEREYTDRKAWQTQYLRDDLK